MEFTYAQIKQLAKELKRPVTDLIALAAQNDPFYQGTPTTVALAEWFADFYHTYVAPGTRVHVRRCHYKILSLGLSLPTNGKPYENIEGSWDILLMASKAARYLNLVDIWAFEDKKNEPPVDYSVHHCGGEPTVFVCDDLFRRDFAFPVFPNAPSYVLDSYSVDDKEYQPYHLEVWCEKSTMNDILVPLCREYGMVLQIGVGELSITATAALATRIKHSGKPARIFYISDFDPAGLSMPVAVSRKLEYFVRNYEMGGDIRLFPLVLTPEQIDAYELPRSPIKESERRKAAFERQHGKDATELDALEALHPGEFERILRGAIETYYDMTLAQRVRQRREEIQRDLGILRQEVIDEHGDDIQAVQAELAAIQVDVAPRMEAYSYHLQNLWQAMSGELRARAPHLDTDVPRRAVLEELGEGLYNSEWDYLEQIRIYKLFQGKWRGEQVDA